MQKSRATRGGRHPGRKTVWLAVRPPDGLDGKSVAGDFEGQVRTIFALMGKTLERTGGKPATS